MSGFDIRQRLEMREETLSPFATRSRLARRDRPEEPSGMRTEFQRDRDRIIHTKAFRRLKHKTQVFIAPLGDHYVTRLTHTLEVSQIARTIARALNLNEDLAEAISLGHDLGHTPFGHVGEDALNEVYPGGFRHNEQSLRIVEALEKDGKGLNLTYEVRDGILKHSKPRENVMGDGWDKPQTFEGQICRIADSIAYINHDIGDALRANLITPGDLPSSAVSILGESHSGRINTLVTAMIENSWAVTGLTDQTAEPVISLSADILEAMNTLRNFLFERVYNAPDMHSENEQARDVVGRLYSHFTSHPNELPGELLSLSDSVERAAVDYIAGMTDQYALSISTRISK